MPLFYARHANDFGIGDFKALLHLVRYCHQCGANLVEILPLTWSAAFNSPYSVLSSMCMDPVYLDISQLVKTWVGKYEKIFLEPFESQRLHLHQKSKVDYGAVRRLKMQIYSALYDKLKKSIPWRKDPSFLKFYAECPEIEDHLIFIILRERFIHDDPSRGWDFRSWPEGIKHRNPDVLLNLKVQYRDEIDFHLFLQWQIHEQWQSVRSTADDLGVQLMGDIPFAVEGADVWMNPAMFNLNATDLKRSFSLGVPPDIYSDTGQYWQFYAYNWQHPDIHQFITQRLAWNFRYFSVVRIDHVLGFYRSYWYYEDPENACTLKSLGLLKKALAFREEGLKHPQRQGDLAFKFYKLLISQIKDTEPIFRTSWLQDSKKHQLKTDHMLLVARKVEADPRPAHLYTRQFSVEKAIFSPSLKELEFMRLSGLKEHHDHERVCSYLFDLNSPPEPQDSFRPCLFVPAPGEPFLKHLLDFSNTHKKLLVFETLGVVPPYIRESVERLGAVDYFPMIYGMDPGDGNNPYLKENHREAGLATFALHDSLALKTWWEELPDSNRESILSHLNMDTSLAQLNEIDSPLQEAILKEVMTSCARLKVILISDLTLDGRENGINLPGTHCGNWEARLPHDLNLDRLLETHLASTQSSDDKASKLTHLFKKLMHL